MPRRNPRPTASQTKKAGSLRALYALASLALLSLVAVSLLSAGLRSASAQVAVGEPQMLPGDVGQFAAAGVQERPQLSKGADSYLSVWTDSRTALSGTLVTSGTGLGSLQDIYAARIGADGQVIDTTPIIVSQEQHEQIHPRVGWNGQNWLVSWLTKRPRDQYSHTHDLVAARVSPAGAILDPVPVVIRADVSLESKPAAVIEDGAGNWIVTFESFLPQEGTNIPRGVLAARVSDGGVVLDPGGRLVYNHHNQFMSDSDIARAGDRYLLTFVDVATTSYAVKGLLLDASLNPLRNSPVQLAGGGAKPRVASNGETWFVINRATGTLVGRDGNPTGSTGYLNPFSVADPVVCWDGQYWFVAFSTNYNAATQSHLSHNDLYVSRVTAAGEVLDPTGLPVNQDAGHQVNAAVAPGIGGGAQVAWEDLGKRDVGTARVTRAGVVGANMALALGAPRQSPVRTATNGSGFLAVFRSEISNTARIMGQHLNADGTPADAEPFVISNDPTSGNPSVGWDGANYLAVWDQTTSAGRQTFGALVPAVGNTPGAPFFIANGFLPDAAGLNGTFLVVNILQETSQIKTTQGTIVGGAGAPVGATFKIQRAFNTWPRVAAFAGRWLAVWEFHGNHDDSPGTIYGSFVEPTGTFGAPFVAGNVSYDVTPHLAVSGDQALVVWSNGDIHARRLNADGSSPEPASGAPVSAAAGLQALPAVTWDGDEFVVTWIDQRNELFPQQPRGDIYAGRVSPSNVKFEEFQIAGFALPEESPFVTSAGGLTLFSYSKFNPQPPYAAHRATTRAARFGTPPGVPPALAPANLFATQVNSGVGTVTLRWDDTTDNEDGFKLEIRSGANAFSQIRLLPANATTTTVTNLGTSEPYVFRLRAYNAAGDGGYSNEASAPGTRMTRFTPNTYNEPATVQLAATASDPDGISRVEFLTSADGTNYSLLATDTGAPYSYQWQNVPRGYYYVVARAYDAVGSHTTSLYESFVVYGDPAAAITSPANGATFLAGAPVTINATAQTQNGNDEYLLRMDFYANSTLIGTVQGHYANYQFTWADPPSGTYQLTARPTSSLNLTGSSAPVRITVGAPEANISGRVTDGTRPLSGVPVALSGSRSALTTTDTEGNYFFTKLTAGGSYSVTPQASGYIFNPTSLSFNNLAASQTANFTASVVAASIQFGSANYAVGEEAGSALVNITRSVNTNTAVSVGYSTAGGTTSAGTDYTATSGVLNFAAGETSKTIAVPILDDAAVEGAETFNVALNSLGGDALIGSPSSTTVTITDNDTCSYRLSQTANNSAAAGGSVTVGVTAPAGCAWTAASNSSFISLNSSAAGNGDGSATFTVAANTASTQRTGTLTIAGNTYTLTQSGVACTFALSSTNRSVGSTGASGVLNVASAAADCAWTATSDASWITVNTGASRSGNGEVGYSVAANTASTERTGTLTVAGHSFTVTQAGVGCNFALSATNQSAVSAGGSGTVNVTAAAADCAWTASSSASWITINSGVAGSGNGSVNFSVAANTSSQQRTGTLTIAGNTFTLTQAGVGCNFTISSASQSFGATGGAGSVNLTAAATDCAWETASDANWITIGSSASGSGSGIVNFSVAANPGSQPRSATLTIAGQTLTVTQAGVACSYTVGQQTPAELPSEGGAGGFQMIAPQGCGWTVSSLAPWITITSGSSGTGSGTVAFTVAANTGAARTGQILHTDDSFLNVRQAAAPASLRLESATVSVSEGARRAELKVARAGDASGAASVTLQTVDDPESVPCATVNGKAYARCDYATTIETLTWAAGDAQPKTVSIPLIDDGRSEGSETVRIRLSDPKGGVIGDVGTATLTITDNEADEGDNPIFSTPFFVRQQYLDFLSREPEAGEPWSDVLDRCSDINKDPTCDRILVSQSFFGSPEFRLKGFFVYKFYSVALNRRPTYEEFIPDMRNVSGSTEKEVYQKREAFPVSFTGRAEFTALYAAMSNTDFVNTLLNRYALQQITAPDPANTESSNKVKLTREDLINRLDAQSLTRPQVLRAIVESDEVGAAEYNKAFVAMQYYGYLKRTPEEDGYQAWLRVINQDSNNVRVMVDGFLNSTEYRLRFGQP